MATVQHYTTTTGSILQIGFSHNTKCANKKGFCRDNHIIMCPPLQKPAMLAHKLQLTFMP